MQKSSIQHHIINSSIIRKLFSIDTKEKRCKFYLERFREHKQNKLSSNLVVQLLPLLLVLAFFYILSSQNLYFGTVLSGSMEPAFERGDLVLMRSLHEEPRIGDIVMFVPQKDIEPITHRIISIDKYGYIKTKGDANPKEDEWKFKKTYIMGKSVIIGDKPVVIKGLGSILVTRAGDFLIMKKVTREKGIISLFQEFRTLVPLLIFFMMILYISMVFDASSEQKHRFSRNGGKKAK